MRPYRTSPNKPAYTMVVRCGKPGGGKGPLIAVDLSMTLTTASSGTVALFAPSTDGGDRRNECRKRLSKEAPMGEYVVRRLMPVECERLQGFPDGWTDIRKKAVRSRDGGYRAVDVDETPDTPRYKALVNSMAVPVMRWIGERIEAADSEFDLPDDFWE